MADIIAMKTKGNQTEVEEPEVWICECGCATHFLLSTGETVCPSCNLRQPGKWHPSGPVLEANEDDSASFVVLRPGEPIDVAVARFKRALSCDGMLAAVVFNEDGRVISYIKTRSDDTPEERQRWDGWIEDFRKQVFLDG